MKFQKGLVPVFFWLIACAVAWKPSPAQPVLRSSITGTVADRQTQAPVPGATVIIHESDPVIGATTDEQGNFVIRHAAIGNYRLEISCLGYQKILTEFITITSGKQSPIRIFLDESILEIPEVEIRAGYQKNRPINKMATVSARSFSVDETFRFAGSYNDPARMVANFAGVTSGIDNRNDIIVRGNSPVGLQWRIDDMEIPNPNHFAAVGTTGGPVTLLNNNLVTNSDFLTGTFPAQYSNAMAGIFDLKMRTGNISHREYWFGLGWNGIEFGTEGPISSSHGASYLFSYRYSPLQLLDQLGIRLDLVPQYQDINLKINLPTRKTGTFTLTGIGGLSFIQFFDEGKDAGQWLFPDYGENLSNGSDLGVAGLSHQIFPAKDLGIKTMFYIVGSRTRTSVDTFSLADPIPSGWAGELSKEVKYSFSARLTKRLSPQHTFATGLYYDHFRMAFHDSVRIDGQFQLQTDAREKMSLWRTWIQWQYQRKRLNITAGMNGSLLTLNQSWSAEPRLGIQWNVAERHILTFGAGLFSQVQPHVIYFVRSEKSPESTQWNRNLDMTRGVQCVSGYEFAWKEDLRLKTELFYQYLWNVPVSREYPHYSLLNQGHEFFLGRQYAGTLQNNGAGRNYGLEITLERFFRKNFFFLITGSLVKSSYQGNATTWRTTAFDVGFAVNAAGGYEFVVGKKRWGVMSLGFRATWAGGNPYIPFDQEATVEAASPVYDWDEAYLRRFPDYRRMALRFGIRRNLPRFNLEFILDLQYRTSFSNIALQRINPTTGEIRDFFNTSLFPMATWRGQF